ncbi:MAG: peptidase T [Prevotellaceae bacterium]|jgi:tripeptide aminopeptidase|nr:peptidase T [Prevotellaceae bacterium]
MEKENFPSLKKRFLKYVSFDTRSEENNPATPSSEGQYALAQEITGELRQIGLTDAEVDANGYVMATLPSNSHKKLPTIGFIAHLDTSPDASGKVNPRTVTYDGTDIVLSENPRRVLSAQVFPEMKQYIGQELIVTDGNSLLGADDKAGVAEIITAVEYLLLHPEIPHGTIRIAFTPDEEIGRGADLFDVKKFGADWAYTVDGGETGELEYENFNAASASVFFTGRNIHPGYAKGKMINAITLAREFANALPPGEVPESTQGYEGFYHLTKMEGTVESSVLTYIIRDHDRAHFEQRKRKMQEICFSMQQKYGENAVRLTLEDQYYNMSEKINPVKQIVDIAAKAMQNCGILPKIKPIRGGTDGARLSFEGLPCPNIFTGGHNFHGRDEFIPIPSMEAAVNVILEICKILEKGQEITKRK